MKKVTIYAFLFVVGVSSLFSQETLYEQGVQAYHEDRFADALTAFDRFIAENPADPKNDDAKWRAGRSLMHLGRASEAEFYFRDVAENGGNRRDDATFDLGRLLFDTERLDEALEVLSRFEFEFPDVLRTDDAFWYIGQIFNDSGEVEKAENAFRRVLEYTDSNVRDEAFYDLGRLLYDEERNQESLNTFAAFISEFPDDSKADDAMWRSGLILRRLDRDSEAEEMFLRVLALPDSNRRDEAEYQIAKIDYYLRKDYQAVIQRFPDLLNKETLNGDQVNSAILTAKSLYYLGLRNKADHEDQPARDNFHQAITWYAFLVGRETDQSAIAEYSLAMAKSYEHLADLAADANIAEGYLNASESAYEIASGEPYGDTGAVAMERLAELQRGRSPHLEFEIAAYGGFENVSRNFASVLSASAGGVFPQGPRNELYAGIAFEHSDFDFKTGFFNPAVSGSGPQIQRTEGFRLETGWISGSFRNIRNHLNLIASYQLAEYSGDNRYRAALDDSFAWRINPLWRLNIDGNAQVDIYPDYISGTDKRDAFEGSFRPGMGFYGLGPVTIGLSYDFVFKQYFQNTAGTSSRSKQYITNGAILEFQGDFGLFRPSLNYRFGWLESNNYDYTVTGLPVSQFVSDYWDHLYQEIGLDLDFRWNAGFRTTLSGSLKYTAFSNYPARDASNTFTGETRKDIDINLGFSSELILMEWRFLTLSMEAEGWWKHQTSNMMYETTISTNYDYLGAYLGIRFRGR